MRMEWPPAAATSSARRAGACPRTSARSGPTAPAPAARSGRRRRGAAGRSGRGPPAGPRRRGGSAAEHLQPGHEGRLGGVSPRNDQSAPAARGRVLGHGERARHRPQRARRAQAPPPRRRREGRRRHLPGGRQGRQCDAGGRTAGPALRRSAGARLATIRRAGTAKRLVHEPERTRSRASWTAASGSPTTANAGRPARRSTSTWTVEVSSPRTAGLSMWATTREAGTGERADRRRRAGRRSGV